MLVVQSKSSNSSREHWGKVGLSIMGNYCLEPNSFGDANAHLDLSSLGEDGNVWALIHELKLRMYSHQKRLLNLYVGIL